MKEFFQKEHRLSHARFNFNNRNYWCPTIDFSYLTTVSNFGKDGGENGYKNLIDNTLLVEEFLHRFLTIATDIRRNMSWLEALANCKILSILQFIKNLFKKNKSIKLYVPLGQNIPSLVKIPYFLKKDISDLIEVCKRIITIKKEIEPIVETITLINLKRILASAGGQTFFENYKETKLRKLKNSYLNEYYSKIDRFCSNINDLTLMTQPILNPKLNEIILPLTLRDSLETFNGIYLSQIRQRVLKLLTIIEKYKISNDEHLKILLNEKSLISLNLEESASKFVEYHTLIEFFAQRGENIELFVPVLAEQFYNDRRKIEREDIPKIVKRFARFGYSSIGIMETIDNKIKKFWSNEPNYLMNAFLTSFDCTYIKSFLLNAKEECPFSGIMRTQCNSCGLSGARVSNSKPCVILCPRVDIITDVPFQILSTN